MIMTIYDFVDFMIDTCQKIEVFGCNEEETIRLPRLRLTLMID